MIVVLYDPFSLYYTIQLLTYDFTVCSLSHLYFRDVRTIARRYFERLARTYVQNVPAIPSAAPAAATGAAPPTTTSSTGAGVSNAATTAAMATGLCLYSLTYITMSVGGDRCVCILSGGAQKTSSPQPAAAARPALPLQPACGEPITPMVSSNDSSGSSTTLQQLCLLRLQY